MNLKDKKGSISIFVLVGLLFMSAFLIILYAANVNKSKTIQEQFNTISRIYLGGTDEESYTDAYTDLRKKNARLFSFKNEADASKTIFEDTSTVELTKTFDGNMSNYRIYGNSVQGGIPTPSSPVEIQSVGDLVTDETNENYGKYKINIKTTTNLLKCEYLNTTETYAGVVETIDQDGVITLNGNSTGSSFAKYISAWSFFLPAGTYSLKANMTGSGVDDSGNLYEFNFIIQTADTGVHTTVASSTTKTTTFTTTQDFNCQAFIYINKTGVNFNNIKYYPILVEGEYTDSNMPEFQPYKEQETIYLNEPLRKVGDYADYIDFENSKVIRKVEVIDGISLKDAVITNAETSIGTKPFRIKTNLELSTFECMSSHFVYKRSAPFEKDNYCIIENNCVVINERADFPDIDDVREFLETSGVKFYACLTTPKEEAIDLPELKTVEDYTKIEILTEVAPSKIEVEYQGYTLD